MNLKKLLGLLVVFIALVAVYFLVHVPTDVEQFDIKPPTSPPIDARSFETPESQVLVPVEVSLRALEQAAEEGVPRKKSGEKDLPNYGPAAKNKIEWQLTRTSISVSESNGRLHLETKIAGSATVRGRVEPIRGTIGKLLGKLKPAVPFSQTVKLAATVHASMKPRLTKSWRVQPNIQGQAQLEEARARIAKIINLSFKSKLQGDVNRAINKEVVRFNERVEEDDFLEKAARDAWAKLCSPISVGDVGQPPLFLVIKPLEFLAMQPEIDGESVQVGLGLRAKTRLLSNVPEDLDCSKFPQELTIVKEVNGGSVIALDATLSYSVLNEQLARQLQDGGLIETRGARAEIKVITLAPFGNRLLATVEGTFRETRFLGTRVEGKLFFDVEPTLDEGEQTIGIKNVKIDASSNQALGKVAAGVLSVLAPAIEERLRRVTLDLKPLAEKERERASKALRRLAGKQSGFGFSKADISKIRLREIQVDNTGVRVLLMVRAKLAVDAITVPLL